MTKDDLQQLKTVHSWLEQFGNDVLAIREKEQEILSRFPKGFTEVKLKMRVEHLTRAISLIEQARQEVALVGFDDSQQTIMIET